MVSSNLTKFLVVSGLIFTLFAGCSLWPGRERADPPETPEVSAELKSEIPFAGREPERFQAEIVVTAQATERRTFVARDGAQRRYDFNFGAKNQLTSLRTDKNYLLLPARKIFTETVPPTAAAAADEWTDFLTTEWLSARTPARFEKLETAGNLTKYRVVLGESAASEVLIYIDENLGLPVRQEFFAPGGEPKTLTYLFELKNLKLETDGGLFSVPADYKKVSADEFGKFLHGEE